SLVAGFSIKDNKDFENQAKIFLSDYNFSNILITRSENGMMLVSKDKILNFPTSENSILSLENLKNERGTYMLSKIYG
mgnify:CR=1